MRIGMSALGDIPPEILLHVLQYCNDKDIFNCLASAKLFNTAPVHKLREKYYKKCGMLDMELYYLSRRGCGEPPLGYIKYYYDQYVRKRPCTDRSDKETKKVSCPCGGDIKHTECCGCCDEDYFRCDNSECKCDCRCSCNDYYCEDHKCTCKTHYYSTHLYELEKWAIGWSRADLIEFFISKGRNTPVLLRKMLKYAIIECTLEIIEFLTQQDAGAYVRFQTKKRYFPPDEEFCIDFPEDFGIVGCTVSKPYTIRCGDSPPLLCVSVSIGSESKMSKVDLEDYYDW